MIAIISNPREISEMCLETAGLNAEARTRIIRRIEAQERLRLRGKPRCTKAPGEGVSKRQARRRLRAQSRGAVGHT